MDEGLNKFEQQIREAQKAEAVEIDAPKEEYEEEVKEPKPIGRPKKKRFPEREVEEIQEDKKEKIQDYSEIIEDMPELKFDLEYLRIKSKFDSGKDLTVKETTFKEQYELAKYKEIEQQELQDKQYEEEQLNKEFEEFKKQHPDKVESVDTTRDFSMVGSENFLKVAMMFLKLKKTKKKGGKIFVKVARPKKVSFEYTNKDLKYIEFWGKNERNEPVKEVTRVTEYQYSFNGTSIPVVFAIQGVPISYDFYSGMKKDLSSEFVSGLVMEAYNLGYKDGTLLIDKNKKNNTLLELMPYLVVAILVIMGIVAYLCYSIYQDNTQILNALEAIKNTAQVGVQVVGP
jgi:hypothetical protein